jgi:hypothetical protein
MSVLRCYLSIHSSHRPDKHGNSSISAGVPDRSFSAGPNMALRVHTYLRLFDVYRIRGGIFGGDVRAGLELADKRSLQQMDMSEIRSKMCKIGSSIGVPYRDLWFEFIGQLLQVGELLLGIAGRVFAGHSGIML